MNKDDEMPQLNKITGQIKETIEKLEVMPRPYSQGICICTSPSHYSSWQPAS